MVYRIAIVEDERKAAERLEQLILGHDTAGRCSFEIEKFSDAMKFLSEYRAEYDLIFFDIQMPVVSGMEAAKEIRKTDENVVIVFVTQMIGCAVDGYSVRAFDFIVKPVNVGSFAIKFDRIINMLEKKRDDRTITVRDKNGYKRLNVYDILYVEVFNHSLIYHLTEGEVVVRGTMTEAEKRLGEYHFCRCNSCYLVNLKHVREVSGEHIQVGPERLKISQTKKQSFLTEFAKYVGGGAC